MITGHRPFVGRTNADVMAAILNTHPPDLAQYGVEVPDGLPALIATSLAKDAADRPANVLDALSRLKEISRSFHREPRFYAAAVQQTSETRATVNLPAQTTSLFGRDRELEEVVDIVRNNSVRLVTLTGAGGTGKTRLAIAVAHRLLDDFADGVFFVFLESVSDPALIAPTIANVLGVQAVPGERHLALLQQYSGKSSSIARHRQFRTSRRFSVDRIRTPELRTPNKNIDHESNAPETSRRAGDMCPAARGAHPPRVSGCARRKSCRRAVCLTCEGCRGRFRTDRGERRCCRRDL